MTEVDLPGCTVPPAPAFGIRGDDTNNVLFKDCVMFGNDGSSIGDNGYGILWTDCNLFKFSNVNCAKNGGLAEGAGFSFINCTNGHTTNEVLSNGNFAKNDNGIAYGYKLDNCSYLIFEGADSIRNQATTVYGFYATSGSNNLYESGQILGNDGDPAAGILLHNEKNTIIRDNDIFDNTAKDTIYGIHLTGHCINCVIDSNRIKNNIGQQKSYGVKDYYVPSAVLVIRNTAFNNGKNYSVTYPNKSKLPIIKGSISKGFPKTGDKSSNELANFDLQP